MDSEDQLTRSQKLLSSSNFCNEAYKLIVKGITSLPDKSQSKWIADCENYENSIEWDKSYILPFYCTKETKLQTFQFKLLHRRITTNDYLYKIGISLTDICTFCEQKKDSLIHLFWDCEFVQTFWQNIQHWLIQHQIKPQNFSLTLPICLGPVDNTEDILFHHALLIGRYHIYSSKIKNTLSNLQVFSQTFLKCQEIEKCYAYKTNTVKKYNSKWNLFKWTVTSIHFSLSVASLLPFSILILILRFTFPKPYTWTGGLLSSLCSYVLTQNSTWIASCI